MQLEGHSLERIPRPKPQNLMFKIETFILSLASGSQGRLAMVSATAREETASSA